MVASDRIDWYNVILIILISVFNDIKIKMKLFSSYLASLSGLMTLVPYNTTRTPLKMPITTGRVDYCGQSSTAQFPPSSPECGVTCGVELGSLKRDTTRQQIRR